MNQLKVHQRQTITALFAQGWSKRRIARELDVDRATVRKYLAGTDSKSPTPHTGSADQQSPKSPTPHTGSEAASPAKSPTHPHTGSSGGPPSVCQPWREQIEQWIQAGLSVQRMYQDLVTEHQFAGSYYAVRRFVRRRQGGNPLPFRRMECEPGQELQVDFGQGAWVVGSQQGGVSSNN